MQGTNYLISPNVTQYLNNLGLNPKSSEKKEERDSYKLK